MHKSWIAAPILAVALVALNASAQTCGTTDADKTAVVDTMSAFYAAATVDDLPGIGSVTAPKFYAFDLGQRYDSIDSLFKPVKAYHERGVKLVWKVTQPEVTIHCKDAWITYVNDGSVQMPGDTAPTPLQWLESAILEKQDGRWKIVFFHSTRVPPPTTAK